MKTTNCLTLAAVALVALMAPAHAQLTLTLTPTSPVIGYGQTLNFLSSLTNNTGEAIDFVNGSASFTGTDTSGFVLDDTAFIINFPTPLADGATFSELMSLAVPANALEEDYTVSYSLDVVGVSNTTYTISSANALFTVIPESGTASLATLGALLVTGTSTLARRRKK